MVAHLTVFLLVVSLQQLHATVLLIPSPPEIIGQPPTDEILFEVDRDKPVFLKCEAFGEPAPSYYWTKNGKPFQWQIYDDRISQQPGRGNLVFTKLTDDDVGQYQCFAKNELGVATSNSVFMRIHELKSFKDITPVSLVGNEGEPFSLSCHPPDGYPKPEIHWLIKYTTSEIKLINNSRITADPEGHLWFSNLALEDTTDDFMYACSASSRVIPEYKIGNRILLTVVASGMVAASNKREPVVQYVSRKNEVAVKGKRVELFCIFGGTPLPQTLWLKDAKPIQFNDNIFTGNYGKSLVIKVVDFEDEGTYTCDVSNGVGENKTHSTNLKVSAMPYFTVEPKSIKAAEDETVEIHCEATGVPKPEVEWIYNGKPLVEASVNPRRIVGSNSVKIENIKKSDIGNYGCNASNSLGYIYKDVYVNVLALPPTITEPYGDIEEVDGKTIILPCGIYGVPKPTIKWTHSGKELTGGRYKILENGDLHIVDGRLEDSGLYVCHAENKFGNTKFSVNLITKNHTVITEGPEDQKVTAGSQITFHCTAIHDESLDLEIAWLINGTPIDFEEDARFVEAPNHSLVIKKTTELDSGVYTCNAITRLDKVNATASLTVEEN